MKKLLMLALVLVPIATAAADEADNRYYDGMGEAAIENGNKKLAHDQALEAAKRDALIKGAGAIIDTATIVEGGTMVQDRIYSHANGYIKPGYEVGEDGEDKDNPGVWRVTLHHVSVSRGDVSKDMDAIHAALVGKAHPRIYMLLREQSIETVTGASKGDKTQPAMAQLNQGIAAARMEKQMTDVGWHFVDPEVASGKVHVDNAMTTDLSGLNGRDFATTGADYVVLGSLVVRPAASEEDASRYGTPVELRAVVRIKSTDTGETVASIDYSKVRPGAVGFMVNARLAMEDAGDDIAKALSGQVLKKWNANSNGVGSLHLLVAVADYDVLTAFEDQLEKGVANVKGVKEVSFADGKADLAVMMTGTSSRQLAGSLSSKSVKGMQVKVTKVTENTVEVKLVR